MMSITRCFSDSRAFVVALVDAVIVQRELKTKNLATICSQFTQPDADDTQVPESALLEQLHKASNRAGRVVPRSTCLTRSLALQRRLQRYSINSQLCIGADPVQGAFGAHAWVEVDGKPINSAPSVDQGFKFRFVPDSILKVADTANPQLGITRHD